MKKKGLKPLIFALIFAMLLTSMNAAPVLAAKKTCNHIYAEIIYGEDGKCIGTFGGRDRMQYTKTCLKCKKRVTYYGWIPHHYSVRYEKLIGKNKYYETYKVYNRCKRYSKCRAEKYVTQITKQHTWKTRSSGRYTIYTCQKCGFTRKLITTKI